MNYSPLLSRSLAKSRVSRLRRDLMELAAALEEMPTR